MPYEKVWNIHETAAEKNGKSVSGSIFGDFIAERGDRSSGLDAALCGQTG